jgi:hypothetical protein
MKMASIAKNGMEKPSIVKYRGVLTFGRVLKVIGSRPLL